MNTFGVAEAHTLSTIGLERLYDPTFDQKYPKDIILECKLSQFEESAMTDEDQFIDSEDDKIATDKPRKRTRIREFFRRIGQGEPLNLFDFSPKWRGSKKEAVGTPQEYLNKLYPSSSYDIHIKEDSEFQIEQARTNSHRRSIPSRSTRSMSLAEQISVGEMGYAEMSNEPLLGGDALVPTEFTPIGSPVDYTQLTAIPTSPTNASLPGCFPSPDCDYSEYAVPSGEYIQYPRLLFGESVGFVCAPSPSAVVRPETVPVFVKSPSFKEMEK